MATAAVLDRAIPSARKKRRWRIPPPLVQDGDGPGPEGLAILDEIEGELGVVLWKSLRSTLLWAETASGNRRKLFDKEVAGRRGQELQAFVPADQPELRAALEDLLSLLASPETVEAEFIGRACTRIAACADDRDAPLTRLEFLQAAAICCPENGRYALEVGRRSRDLTRYSMAEAWYHRALGLARQVGDWETYVRAYLSHGTMMLRRGALPAGRRSFMKALRRSRRQGLRQVEGEATHDLCVLEWRAGNRTEALGLAEEAVRICGPEHPRLPRLAHDVAYFWLDEGHYHHALPVFMATLGKVKHSDQPTVLGSIARAAAGVGDVLGYEWSRRTLQGFAPGPGVAESWIDFAYAASMLGRIEEMEEAAKLAESIAQSRKEGQMRFAAESILEKVRRRSETPRPAEVTSEDGRNDVLARDLIRALQATPSLVPAAAGN
jgi:tetratricopeptide (TPR) repeat protein